MKRLLTWALILCLLCAGAAAAGENDSQSFRGIPWLSSEEDVRAKETEGSFLQSQESGNAFLLRYEGVSFMGYDNIYAIYMLTDDKLLGGEYMIRKDSIGSGDSLMEAYSFLLTQLTTLYGEANGDIMEYLLPLYALMGAPENYANDYLDRCEAWACWKFDDTAVILTCSSAIELVYMDMSDIAALSEQAS